MKFATRCLPFGALPYETLDSATRMQAKLFEQMPYLAFLPVIDSEDDILKRTFSKFPGVKIKSKKVVFKVSSNSFKQGFGSLEKAFNNPTKENLEPFAIESPFLDKYFEIIKKFKSKNACINLLGPFTVAQILSRDLEENTIFDRTYRKLFAQAVCVKAFWFIEKLKTISPKTTPVIILEETMLSNLGDLKRENEEITDELVINFLAKIIEKLKSAGAIVAIQCMEKCNWQVPIRAGVDIISFDAYNNPNNLNIFTDDVIEFVERGGMINWGIIPTMNESIVKGLTIDYIRQRLFATFDGLIISGVPAEYVYNSALVSTQGNASHLPIIFAEKAVILSMQLSKKIPTISSK